MKPSEPRLWKDDSGTFIGYRLEEGYASEHEHGIDTINKEFGIHNYMYNGDSVTIKCEDFRPFDFQTVYKPIFGIDGNRVTKNVISDVRTKHIHNNEMYYVYGSTSWLGDNCLPDIRTENTLSYFNRKRQAEWSSSGFIIAELKPKYLQELVKIFEDDDGIIRYEMTLIEKYYKRTLTIARYSKVPEFTKQMWYKQDEYDYNAWLALFNSGIPSMVKRMYMGQFVPVFGNEGKLLIFWEKTRKWHSVNELKELLKNEVKFCGNNL